jgi:uncharacterized RDD family membrane protein YckC
MTTRRPGKPVSPVPREARPYQGRAAGVVTRLLAGAVDLVVVVVAVLALYAGYAALLFLWSPTRFRFPDVPVGVLTLLGGLLAVLYLALAWATTGRSYGGHLLGLRVVSRRGRRLSVPVALLRALLCVLVPLGLLWCAVSGTSSSLQDLLVRTRVVYDWAERPR